MSVIRASHLATHSLCIVTGYDYLLAVSKKYMRFGERMHDVIYCKMRYLSHVALSAVCTVIEFTYTIYNSIRGRYGNHTALRVS